MDIGLQDGIAQLIGRLGNYPPHEVFVEIALIWLVVYAIFRFLRGTRGARILKGVGLLLIIATVLIGLLSRNDAAFQRLRFLYGHFLTFASLALVIVFQPELRRALIRLGEAKIFAGSNQGVDVIIREVLRAVKYLAKNKIGALIAIERDVGLEGLLELGTKINADLRAELIETIFWPGTVLHDMGMVVRGEKILAAGVQFPLAEADDLGQELGSRHRAAVGLSLEADCLVIIVSEETGIVSLAERGQLVRKLSIEMLRTLLTNGLAKAEDVEKKSRGKREEPVGTSIERDAAVSRERKALPAKVKKTVGGENAA